jgi:hypothetical protein
MTYGNGLEANGGRERGQEDRTQGLVERKMIRPWFLGWTMWASLMEKESVTILLCGILLSLGLGSSALDKDEGGGIAGTQLIISYHS